ncbi:TD and POZ domain-containing protein 1-like [Microplitis mediator]|uniref:TD and POZ domain-containing protein 1-like n=1 Tax=Microplitis mediator TaxID=375433 RepID=UPI002554B7AC|nr:TD and POZ domain-containing protein 1-like [Microplitis mediator]
MDKTPSTSGSNPGPSEASNETTFKTTFVCQSRNELVTSSIFCIKNVPGLSCYLTVKWEDTGKLQLRIVKNHIKSAAATIEFSTEGVPPLIMDLSDWKDVHVTEFPLSRHCIYSYANVPRYDLEVICSVIWYGFTDELYNPALYKHMEHYFKNTEFSDVVIKVKDKEFPAHKMVLASHSPVLRTMLTTDMKESNENCITFQDFNEDLVNELLTYFYTGKLEKANDDYNMALKLLEFGGMYQVNELKNICGLILGNNLKLDNVLILLEYARIHECQILKQRAIAFIILNRKQLFV